MIYMVDRENKLERILINYIRKMKNDFFQLW